MICLICLYPHCSSWSFVYLFPVTRKTSFFFVAPSCQEDCFFCTDQWTPTLVKNTEDTRLLLFPIKVYKYRNKLPGKRKQHEVITSSLSARKAFLSPSLATFLNKEEKLILFNGSSLTSFITKTIRPLIVPSWWCPITDICLASIYRTH